MDNIDKLPLIATTLTLTHCLYISGSAMSDDSYGECSELTDRNDIQYTATY